MSGRHERIPDPDAPEGGEQPPPPPIEAPRDLALWLVVAGAVVVLVALAIVVVLKMHKSTTDLATNGPTTSRPPSATKTAGATTTTAKPTATKTPSPTKTPAPTAPATTTPAPTTSSPAPSKTPTPTKAPTTPPPPVAKSPLLVLNNSAVNGLAARAASDFRSKGWTVAGTGNLTGRIKDTTVYFSPGFEAAARELAREFPQLHRVLPRIAGLPGTAKLTVVLTRYYRPGA